MLKSSISSKLFSLEVKQICSFHWKNFLDVFHIKSCLVIFSLVEFINSQVMLKGIENAGCLLVTAGNAEVFNRLHRPTQSGRKLLNKKSWVGHLENMQVVYCENTKKCSQHHQVKDSKLFRLS